MVVAGANVHDTKLLEQILKQVVVAHPVRTGDKAQILWDITTSTSHRAVAAYRYRPHVRRIGEEKLDQLVQTLPRPKMGGRIHPGLALQMPSNIGALRQEGI